MEKTVLERIEQRLKAVGMTARAASMAAGLSADAIRNLHRAAAQGRDATVNLKTANALAPVLGTTAAWLLTEEGPEEPELGVTIVRNERFVPVPVVGRAAAGLFFEVDGLDQSEPRTVTMPHDRDFPNARQIAFEVEGDSMNALRPRPILHGDTVICLAYEDIADRMIMRDGMVVVVERVREGGHIREWSVKQIALFEDRVEFCPRSTNPKHKPIVVHRDAEAEGVTVEVLAVVRQVVNGSNIS